jgi:hypothetical protein
MQGTRMLKDCTSGGQVTMATVLRLLVTGTIVVFSLLPFDGNVASPIAVRPQGTTVWRTGLPSNSRELQQLGPERIPACADMRKPEARGRTEMMPWASQRSQCTPLCRMMRGGSAIILQRAFSPNPGQLAHDRKPTPRRLGASGGIEAGEFVILLRHSLLRKNADGGSTHRRKRIGSLQTVLSKLPLETTSARGLLRTAVPIGT